jgi:transcriptional regulator with XRE-family HTH domain
MANEKPGTVGQRVALVRRVKAMTQAQLGALLGVGGPAVQAFEDGDNDPRVSTVRRYAEALDVSAGWLVDPDAAPPKWLMDAIGGPT